jgi:hypothetical protein
MESERDSADDLATARASLAICEYRGCSGEMPDPQQAVLDARHGDVGVNRPPELHGLMASHPGRMVAWRSGPLHYFAT